ncbi:hypothetical protein C0J52_16089 [Blattella germanica]|nr:hypothetical protein C0J52_16089 [Blattella germanica]
MFESTYLYMPMTIMGVAMFGRLCIGAVYAVIILQTSELFPTANRNTAVGTSSTMSHLGGLLAPYIVDLLVNRTISKQWLTVPMFFRSTI